MKRNNYNKILFFFDKHPHLLIVFGGILLRLPLLFAPLTFSSDAWRQADTASIAYHFYANGFRLLYPQIFWGGNGPGYVETEFQLYTFIVSLLYALFGEHYWLGRLVSLFFSVLTWLAFYSLAVKFFFGRPAARWALVFLVFSPLSLRYSVAFMPEAAALFFYVASLLFFWVWIATSRRSSLLLSSFCVALAILIKPTTIHIGLIFGMLGFERFGKKVFRDRLVWLSAVLALIPGLFWYWHARNLYLIYGNTFGLLSGGDSKFGNLNIWLSPRFYLNLAELDLKWVLGYGMIFLFVAGAIIALGKKEFRLVIFGIVTLGLYYFIVARYARVEWGIQYHVYMLPFAALAVGIGAEWVFEKFSAFPLWGIIGGSMGIFFLATIILFGRMMFPDTDGFVSCGNYVKSVVPANQKIIVSTTSGAVDDGVPNNYQEPGIFFYSRRYGWSLPADQHSVTEVARLRGLGAAYFVIYSKGLLEDNQELYEYLKSNSAQVGPGIDYGCAIYRFEN